MKTIPLTQGKFAIVDDEDYEELNKYKWHAIKDDHTYYAARTVYLGGGRKNRKRRIIQMHRQILQALPEQQIDHKNGNGLNNRRCNIRFCTHSQNQQNQRAQKSKSSKYKGIYWHKRDKKWATMIQYNKKRIHLGYFDNEIKAAKAYDKKAKELFGEFANCNFN